jgi:CRISPR-associated protein Cas1
MRSAVSATPATKRVIEVSGTAYVRLRDSQIVVERDGVAVGTVPAEDIGVLLIDGLGVAVTSSALASCWKQNAAVVLCDERHLPGAIILPLSGHSLSSAVLADQLSLSLPARGRLWQQIVRAKIDAQGELLVRVGSPTARLRRLSSEVRSGDKSNAEAQAARLYWPRLFGAKFRRDTDADGINSLLNYGYAVLRAAVARAICAAGLNPALGLKHSNQFNPLPLADDLMEPLRPVVDAAVHAISIRQCEMPVLSRDTKAELLGVLSSSVVINDQSKPLTVGCHEYATSLRRVTQGEEKQLAIPTVAG